MAEAPKENLHLLERNASDESDAIVINSFTKDYLFQDLLEFRLKHYFSNIKFNRFRSYVNSGMKIDNNSKNSSDFDIKVGKPQPLSLICWGLFESESHSLPELFNNIEALSRISHVCIILNCADYPNDILRRILFSGFSILDRKILRKHDLLEAINVMKFGNIFIHSTIRNILKEAETAEINISLEKSNVVSIKDLETISLVEAGASNKEIASIFDISEGAVKARLHKIFQKLDCRNRTELIHIAREKNLI